MTKNNGLSTKENSILRELTQLRNTFEREIDNVKEVAKEALISSKEAADKALSAIDKRLEGVNEFRGQMADQQRTYIPRQEVEIMFKNISERTAKNEELLSRIDASKKGSGETWAYVIGAIGLLIGIITLIVKYGK